MDIEELIEFGRERITEFHEATGVPCSLYRPSYNAAKGLYGPPYVVLEQSVPVSIGSLSTIQDPDAYSIARTLNISFEQYRLLTCPVGQNAIEAGYRLVKEPVSSTADTYHVVEAMAPDESSPLEYVLHCQKL